MSAKVWFKRFASRLKDIMLKRVCNLKTVSILFVFFVSPVDTPYLTETVNENSAKDVYLLTVGGQAGDRGYINISYFKANPISPPFELDNNTGVFKKSNGLDAETSQSFNFTFGVLDGRITIDSFIFSVNISGLNDIAPQSVGKPYTASLLDSVFDGGNTGGMITNDANGQITVVNCTILNGSSTIELVMQCSSWFYPRRCVNYSTNPVTEINVHLIFCTNQSAISKQKQC